MMYFLSLILAFYPKGHKSQREKGRTNKCTRLRIGQSDFRIK